MIAVRRSESLLPFVLLAAGVCAAELLLVRPAIATSRWPSLLAMAMLVDVVVVVPAAYWWLCLRGRQPAARVMPVLALSLAAAGALMPAGFRGVVPAIRLLAAPAEVGLLWMVARRARAAFRAAPASAADAGDRIRQAAVDAVPYRAAGEAVAYEFALLYYAVVGWRARPAEGASVFSYHRRSGYGGIVFAVAVATAVEAAAVHLLIAPRSTVGAWAVTAVSLYGMLWMWGDFQAMRLRPVVVGDDGLHLRVGLRWTAHVPWDAVAELRPAGRAPMPRRAPGWLRMTAMGEATLVLELSRPVDVRGPYGITRRVQRIGLAPDDAAGFRTAVAARLDVR